MKHHSLHILKLNKWLRKNKMKKIKDHNLYILTLNKWFDDIL